MKWFMVATIFYILNGNAIDPAGDTYPGNKLFETEELCNAEALQTVMETVAAQQTLKAAKDLRAIVDEGIEENEADGATISIVCSVQQ